MNCVLKAAAEQAGRIMERIRSLSEMPMRYRLYGDEPWHSRGLRFFSIDNYFVFYLSEENDNIVYIVCIMYSGRELRRQLKETKIEY